MPEHHIEGNTHELQEKISNGDQHAFADVYRIYGKKLIHFASSLTRSKELAEEIVEDVFVGIWSNRSDIASINNLTVYLYVAVKNRSLTTLSKKAKELITAQFDHLEPAIDEFGTDPYDLMITTEMMNRMKLAIDALPPRCKMIFKLVREDGLKYKEVAEILNISVNTIDAQMAIAVKKICQALEISRTSRKPSGPVSKK